MTCENCGRDSTRTIAWNCGAVEHTPAPHGCCSTECCDMESCADAIRLEDLPRA